MDEKYGKNVPLLLVYFSLSLLLCISRNPRDENKQIAKSLKGTMLEFQGHVGLGCGECQGQFSKLSPCSQNSCLQWMWHLLLQRWLGRLSPLETWIQILAWFRRGKRLVVLTSTLVASVHITLTHTTLWSWWTPLGKSQSENGRNAVWEMLAVALLSSCLPLAGN